MKTHEEVYRLRAEGKTYLQISEETGYSKSSISYILKDYPGNAEMSKTNRATISEEQQSKMREGANSYYEKQRKVAFAMWSSRLEKLDPVFRAYISGLYDGEGRHSGTRFSLCNSDMAILKAFKRFLEEIDATYTVRLSIPRSLCKESCMEYWKDFNIDGVDQVDNRPQKKARLHKKDYYGTLTLGVSCSNMLREALEQYSFKCGK